MRAIISKHLTGALLAPGALIALSACDRTSTINPPPANSSTPGTNTTAPHEPAMPSDD
jgi:hypothetical protein